MQFFLRVQYTLVVLLAITIGSTITAEARQDKNAVKTQLIDLFYQAISSPEGLPEGTEFKEIALLNYTREIISPRTIIQRYPSAKRFLVEDSMMVIPGRVEFQGFIEDLAVNDAHIEISNFIFRDHTTVNLNLYADLESEIFNASDLSFKNCRFENTLMTWFSNLNIRIENNEIKHLWLLNESMIAPVLTIRNNNLVKDNAGFIEGRVDGQQIVILTKFVKKST